MRKILQTNTFHDLRLYYQNGTKYYKSMIVCTQRSMPQMRSQEFFEDREDYEQESHRLA